MITNEIPMSAKLLAANGVTSESRDIIVLSNKFRDIDEIKDAWACCLHTAKKAGMSFADLLSLTIFLLYKSGRRGEFVGAIIHVMIKSLYDADAEFFLTSLHIKLFKPDGEYRDCSSILNQIGIHLNHCTYADSTDFFEVMYPNFQYYGELFYSYYKNKAATLD